MSACPCGSPSEPGRVHCGACLAEYRVVNKAARDERRENDQCGRCTSPATVGRLCAPCAEYVAAKRPRTGRPNGRPRKVLA